MRPSSSQMTYSREAASRNGYASMHERAYGSPNALSYIDTRLASSTPAPVKRAVYRTRRSAKCKYTLYTHSTCYLFAAMLGNDRYQRVEGETASEVQQFVEMNDFTEIQYPSQVFYGTGSEVSEPIVLYESYSSTTGTVTILPAHSFSHTTPVLPPLFPANKVSTPLPRARRDDC